MSLTQAEIDGALTALGFPLPPGSLRDVHAVVATEMGLHRCTVRVRLDGVRCIVEVPEGDLDDAAKAGADEIEIVSVRPAQRAPKGAES